MPRRAILFVFLSMASLLNGCSHSSRSDTNVLLIVVDTLRADRLGAYGSERGLTPFLDSLARHANVFERAYAQSSWTNPSIASLMTSRLQSEHRVFSFGSSLSEDETTLAEVLGGAGYATAAFSANVLLRRGLGFAQGFDVFENVSRPDRKRGKGFLKGRAEAVRQKATAWVDALRSQSEGGPPAFLYVHYMEPHAPYDPPQELIDEVLGDRPASELEKANLLMGLAVLVPEDPAIRAIEAYYDVEVRSLDADLERLFAELEARGFLENCVVVVTADHGEEFYEHEVLGHHQSLYEEVIRVPLILRLPGQAEGAKISAVVSLVDVAPTIFELAGVRPPQSFGGHSLLYTPGLRGLSRWMALRKRLSGEAGPLPAFSELIKKEGTLRQTAHERAVIDDGDKLIVGVDGGREYYELAEDPQERIPAPGAAAARLDRILSGLGSVDPGGPGQLDAETKERMRALGYAE
jgi:arylsulfatase A-like enzyme